MYLTNFGTVNHILDFFGLDRFAWLASGKMAIYGVMFADIWSWTPWMFLILYGGLRTLPTEPMEAAEIDGASTWRILWNIILPLLSPVIIIAITLKSIDTFKTFDYVWIMTRGGPGGSSHIASTYIYETAMNNLNYGYGAAMAIIVLLICFMMAIGFIFILKKTESQL